MKINKDFIFIDEAEMNEGLTSGTVSKVALYFTKDYLFVIPYDSIHIWNSTKTEFNNAEEFTNNLTGKSDNLIIEEFQNICINFLPNSRIYKIQNLEKFNIKVGFFIFGGLTVKKRGEQLQTINVQPRSIRIQLKEFYKNIV